MYINKEELEKRLNRTELVIKKKIRADRKTATIDEEGNKVNGEKRLTNEERTTIGILSELDTNKNIAELLGVSEQTVSNASRGLTSPTIGVDKELKEGVTKGIEKLGIEKMDREKIIQDQLLTNLAAALGHVANNLDTTDAVEASKIASDMSRILSSVTGQNDNRGSRTAIIINVPAMKDEKSYQTITV